MCRNLIPDAEQAGSSPTCTRCKNKFHLDMARISRNARKMDCGVCVILKCHLLM